MHSRITAPNVGIGLGTKTGLTAALASFILGIVGFVEGDRDEETVAAIVAAGIVLYGVIRGRMEQATAVVTAEAMSAAAAPPATGTTLRR